MTVQTVNLRFEEDIRPDQVSIVPIDNNNKGDRSTMNYNRLASLLMKSLAILTIMALTIVWPKSMEAAGGTIKFVNLSDSNVYIARYNYQPYSPAKTSAGSREGGGSTLAVMVPEQPAGWWFKGWWTIEPGESVSFNESNGSHFHVKNSSRQITWRNMNESHGYVLYGLNFAGFLPTTPSTFDVNRFELDNPRAVVFTTAMSNNVVKYQKIPPGTWTIGNAYRIEKKQFPFEISSRDGIYDTRTFQVPGEVVDYSYNSKSWRAENVRWKQNTTSVELRAYVSGTQKKPFGPREPGYYRGTVTVRYTVRN